MVDELRCQVSRIILFGRPLICHFCGHDVFMPYTTYCNVEKPGIGVYFLDYTAACMMCGCVTQFSDPSRPSADGGYIWALDQFLL